MFKFRLCETLGFAHPDYLMKVLTPQQVADWHCYSENYGMGVARLDPYFANILCQQANLNRGKRGPIPADKFLLYQFDPVEVPTTAKELRSRLLAQLNR